MDRFEELRRNSETHRVIKGRRWRVSDPALDASVRQVLVDGLMEARRGVRDALARSDSAAERHARSCVHDAKVALGERGPKWWEPMDADAVKQRSDAVARTLAARSAPVPDDVAADILGYDMTV